METAQTKNLVSTYISSSESNSLIGDQFLIIIDKKSIASDFIRWGSFENVDADRIYEDVEMLKAYEMALTTWFEWLDNHVNRSKTRVFFVSSTGTDTWKDSVYISALF